MKSMETGDSLVAAIRAYFRRHAIPRGAGIVAALSGGPDSTALALGLHAVREELDLNLTLAHYDHGIRSRDDSEREIEFVRLLGRRLGIHVVVERSPPDEIKKTAARDGLSLEDTARDFRYRFLAGVRTDRKCDFIAVGHTRTDNSETMIYRFFQGSSPEGLAGIPVKRDAVIRPLSGLYKTDITAYLSARGESWCTDSTNEDSAFLRNAVRNRLVPVIREVFPGYEKALENLAGKMLLYKDFAANALEKGNPWRREGDRRVCQFRDFLDLHPLLRIQSLYKLYDSTPGGVDRAEKRLPFAFLAPVAGLEADKRDGTVLRGYGVRLVRKGDMLFWVTDSVLEGKKGYLYEIRGAGCIEICGLLRVRIEEVASEAKHERDVFPCGRKGHLIFRSGRPGDVILTSSGRKTLKKLFSDWKLPENLRDMVPVLQDNTEILGVFAQPFGFDNIRLPRRADRDSKDEKYFRLWIYKIGEECG